MKKISVIGCCGIGTDEFGQAISKKTGLPYHDIAEAYYLEEEDIIKNIPFDDREKEMAQKPEWVISGISKHCIKECDTVCFLNYPRKLCGDIIKANPDRGITWGAVVKFHMNTLPEILQMLEKYPEKNIVVLKNEEEKNDFINNL